MIGGGGSELTTKRQKYSDGCVSENITDLQL